MPNWETRVVRDSKTGKILERRLYPVCKWAKMECKDPRGYIVMPKNRHDYALYANVAQQQVEAGMQANNSQEEDTA